MLLCSHKTISIRLDHPSNHNNIVGATPFEIKSRLDAGLCLKAGYSAPPPRRTDYLYKLTGYINERIFIVNSA